MLRLNYTTYQALTSLSTQSIRFVALAISSRLRQQPLQPLSAFQPSFKPPQSLDIFVYQPIKLFQSIPMRVVACNIATENKPFIANNRAAFNQFASFNLDA